MLHQNEAIARFRPEEVNLQLMLLSGCCRDVFSVYGVIWYKQKQLVLVATIQNKVYC